VVSPDNRWLVVGTRAAGIGIYDSARRAWLTVRTELYDQLPALTITHLLWWRDRFWIGTPAGLTSLRIAHTNEQQLHPVDTTPGTVIDLDADPDGALWVLMRQPCETGGNDCLWLGTLANPDQAPTVLIHERNIYTDLGLANVHFAQDWGEQLVIAGEAGIYSYTPHDHNWQQNFAESVSATLPRRNQPGFYFGFTKGVGRLQPAAISSWEIKDPEIAKLLYGHNEEVLALTKAGNLFALSDAREPRTVFARSATTLEPDSFTAAADLHGTVLFAGEDGALLHNVNTRTYEDITASQLPEWLRHADVRLLVSGNSLYAIVPRKQNSVRVYRHPVARAALYLTT